MWAEDQQALHKPAAHDSAQRTVEEEMQTKLQGGAATPTGGRRWKAGVVAECRRECGATGTLIRWLWGARQHEQFGGPV